MGLPEKREKILQILTRKKNCSGKLNINLHDSSQDKIECVSDINSLILRSFINHVDMELEVGGELPNVHIY